MENKEKIAAVVVTYNRKELLKKCLSGILSETRPLDRIFIVDNNSTDKTDEYIEKTFGSNKNIEYIKLNENTGSAGGFHDGVKRAYEWGADWIWFLDDDVCPDPDCLEVMLKYKNISKCMNPSKFYSDGKEFFFENVFDTSTGRLTFVPNLSFKNGKDFAFVSVSCFEGMFVHRDIVDKVGFPDKRFFIGGDDMTYGFTISLFANQIFIKDAVIRKLIPFNEILKPQFFYYAVRNQFLVKEYLKKYGLFNKRLFYLHLLAFVFYACVKQTMRNKSLYTVFYIFKGLLHGMKGRFYKM